MRRSAKAWRERYLLERMRQGRFNSREEAFSNGWCELKVTVIGAYISIGDGDEPLASTSIFSQAPKERNFIIDNPITDLLQLEMRETLLQKASHPVAQAPETERRRSIFTADKVELRPSVASFVDVLVESE